MPPLLWEYFVRGDFISNVGRQRSYLKLVIGNKKTYELNNNNNNNNNGLKIIKSGLSKRKIIARMRSLQIR